MKKPLFVLLVGLLACSPQAFAEQQTVTLGASFFPPSAYIDNDTGQCVGENIDVTSRILADYNIKLEVVCALPARMYRLVEHAEVDFTVNVKTTSALEPYVEFIEPPLKQLVINLYRYSDKAEFKTISAIRGFDYNGSRRALVEQNQQFIDLPTAEKALELFLKGRSDGLISYQSNVVHLQQQKALVFPEEVTVTTINTVDAYYGIAKGSKHFELLKHVLTDYANKHNLQYFVQVKTD